MGEGGRLKLDVQGQGGGRILDVAGQEGWGVLKIGEFHERHMCIVPNSIVHGQTTSPYFQHIC